jgi:hypothetical protein
MGLCLPLSCPSPFFLLLLLLLSILEWNFIKNVLPAMCICHLITWGISFCAMRKTWGTDAYAQSI